MCADSSKLPASLISEVQVTTRLAQLPGIYNQTTSILSLPVETHQRQVRSDHLELKS